MHSHTVSAWGGWGGGITIGGGGSANREPGSHIYIYIYIYTYVYTYTGMFQVHIQRLRGDIITNYSTPYSCPTYIYIYIYICIYVYRYVPGTYSKTERGYYYKLFHPIFLPNVQQENSAPKPTPGPWTNPSSQKIPPLLTVAGKVIFTVAIVAVVFTVVVACRRHHRQRVLLRTSVCV